MTLPGCVGVAVPAGDDDLLVATTFGLTRVSWSSGSASELVQLHDDPKVRMNDGSCDPVGRFVGGTLDSTARRAACLYSVEADGSARVLLRDVSISNGIGWNPDGTTMYFVDTPTRRIDEFRYDLATGDIEGRRPLLELPPGVGNPDGLAVDAQGDLWVALWGGSRVVRISPRGRVTQELLLPVPLVTSCCFGGPGLRQLFVTTATRPRGAPRHGEGGIYRYESNVGGVAVASFGAG